MSVNVSMGYLYMFSLLLFVFVVFVRSGVSVAVWCLGTGLVKPTSITHGEDSFTPRLHDSEGEL